jgi:hypothetical protein
MSPRFVLFLFALGTVGTVAFFQSPIPSAIGQEAAHKVAPATKVPSGPALNLLIRTTIIAVNQANQTGNYTVLRELASPDFQQANSSARLAEIFGPLRKRKLDLSPVLFFDPKLVKPAAVDASGMLRLSGFFDTRPERVIFDMLFQPVSGNWRLFGISVFTRPAAPPAGAHVEKVPSRTGVTPGKVPAKKNAGKKSSGSGKKKKKTQ